MANEFNQDDLRTPASQPEDGVGGVAPDTGATVPRARLGDPAGAASPYARPAGNPWAQPSEAETTAIPHLDAPAEGSAVAAAEAAPPPWAPGLPDGANPYASAPAPAPQQAGWDGGAWAPPPVPGAVPGASQGSGYPQAFQPAAGYPQAAPTPELGGAYAPYGTPPGYPAPTVPGTAAPASPVSQGIAGLGALFDLNVGHVVTPRLAQGVYILVIVASIGGWLGSILMGLGTPSGSVVMTLLFGWIPALLAIAAARIALDAVLTLIGIHERLGERAPEAGPEA